MPIVGNGAQQYPIAVSALKNLGGDDRNQISSGFDTILMRDLKLSGFFHLIDPKSYIEDAQTTGYDVGQFNFNDWNSIGADFLVKGAVTRDGDKVQVEALLFDIAGQRRMMGKKFNGSRTMWAKWRGALPTLSWKPSPGNAGPSTARLPSSRPAAAVSKKSIRRGWMAASCSQVTNNPTINLFPSLDRGAQHLLYLSYKSMEPKLYLVNLGQQVETTIQPGLGQAVGGTLTPGGSIVAAYERGGNTNLYLLDSSGGQLNAITNNQAINVSPSVCADGTQLAFTSDRSGTPQIYVGNVNGGGAKRITYQGSYNTAPAFSPDCKKIAYESREGGIFQIYVIDAGGGDPKN